MAAPIWLTAVFATVMVTVAVYCAGRLAAARRWRRPTEVDTDAGHVLMGLAMAGLLVARLRLLPAATWEAVFVLGAAWFAWQLLRSRRRAEASPWRCLHPAPHLAECTAMVYMFLALPPSLARRAPGIAEMSGSGSRSSVLALLLALVMFGYVVRVADRLPRRAPAVAAAAPGSAALAPRCAALCKIAMGLTMGYMLVLML